MSSALAYRLAPMSTSMAVLTGALLLIPVWLLITGMPWVGSIVAVLYGWAWLWMRPRQFELTDDALVIAWPMRSRRIARRDIERARTIEAKDFRREHGFAARIGVGGLWGGFGLLWTRPKTFEMYVSRTDGLVIVERNDGRALLITPERPQEFVRALAREQAGREKSGQARRPPRPRTSAGHGNSSAEDSH